MMGQITTWRFLWLVTTRQLASIMDFQSSNVAWPNSISHPTGSWEDWRTLRQQPLAGFQGDSMVVSNLLWFKANSLKSPRIAFGQQMSCHVSLSPTTLMTTSWMITWMISMKTCIWKGEIVLDDLRHSLPPKWYSRCLRLLLIAYLNRNWLSIYAKNLAFYSN